METPAFLKPIQSYPGEIVQFIERIPGVDVTGDRETVLERLEPYHKAEVEALGWRWKDLRRAEQVHGTKVALVGDIGSNYPVEGVDGLICSGVSDCVLVRQGKLPPFPDSFRQGGNRRQHRFQHHQVHEKMPWGGTVQPDCRHFPLHPPASL